MTSTKKQSVKEFFARAYNIDDELYSKYEGLLLYLIFNNLTEKEIREEFKARIEPSEYRLASMVFKSRPNKKNLA